MPSCPTLPINRRIYSCSIGTPFFVQQRIGCFLLYGFIAVNGLKVLIKNQVNFEDPKNVVVASSMLVLGLGGAAISIINGDLSITISGMSLASIVGIILNLFLTSDVEEMEVDELLSNKKYNVYKLKEEIKKELKTEILEELKNERKNNGKRN